MQCIESFLNIRRNTEDRDLQSEAGLVGHDIEEFNL